MKAVDLKEMRKPGLRNEAVGQSARRRTGNTSACHCLTRITILGVSEWIWRTRVLPGRHSTTKATTMSENDDQRPKDNPFEAPSLTPGEAVASDVTTDTPGRTGRVLRHALVVMGLTFAGGFVAGFLSAVLGIPDDQSVPLLIGSNLLMMTSGFVWSAAANRNSRWTHLVAVALCVWPMGAGERVVWRHGHGVVPRNHRDSVHHGGGRTRVLPARSLTIPRGASDRLFSGESWLVGLRFRSTRCCSITVSSLG